MEFERSDFFVIVALLLFLPGIMSIMGWLAVAWLNVAGIGILFLIVWGILRFGRIGFGGRKKLLQGVIVSLARSENGVTLDEIMMHAQITAEEANSVVRELVSRNVLRIEQKNRRTVYSAV